MSKQKKLKSLFIFNILILVVAFIMIQYSVVSHETQAEDEKPIVLGTVKPVMKGRVADAFVYYDEARVLENYKFNTAFDKETSLDDLKGQWVVLNFWATWCPPCLVEMPSLQAMQDNFKGQGVKVVAVSLDRNMNGKKLREFMSKHQFGPIANYYDPTGKLLHQLGLRGLPSTYILAPDGRAIGLFEGDADWTSEDVTAFIASLLTRAQP